MSGHFDDETLIRAPETDEGSERPAPSRSPARSFTAIAVVGLIIGGVGAWLWESRSRMPPGNASQPVTATEAAITIPAAPPLPPLGQMDTFLRALLGALSSHPELARWLATDGLIRQMADAIDKISRGQSPAAEQTALRPPGAFEISGTRVQMSIDPDSYRRYDQIASAVASLDARAVARAYRTIQPRLNEAYRALGRSDNSVDQAVGVALDTLIATPAVNGPIAIVAGKGATYAFADPRLEGLSPAQKHLLRMGPENARIIQTRLRELAAAIAITPAR